MAHRKKLARLFEVFVEFTCTKEGTIQTGLVYPADSADKELLEKLKKMCFPCAYRPANVECFTFVLTDLDASRRYGHVRLSERDSNQQVLCIVSKLDWFDVFNRLLNVIGGIIVRPTKNDPRPFIARAYGDSARILKCAAGESYELVSSEEDMCTFNVPFARPTLKQSRILSEYFSTVRPITMVRVFAHLLHERRILFISRRLSRLTCCIHAAASLIQPFVWQHLFIPVLPDTLIDYLQAPMPFVIGVHQELYERSVRGHIDLGDCCLVMLDNNTVESEYDDLLALPEDVRTHFRRSLQLDKSELRGTDRPADKDKDKERFDIASNCDALSSIFLRAMVLCVGDYREYFVMQPGEPVSFDEERFIAAHRNDATSAASRFFESLRSLQMFQQFIDDRLMRAVTDGSGPRKHTWDEEDVFEDEARAAHVRADDADRRYNAWLAASRDRLADLAVKMKGKSKELRKRFREDLRKSQLNAARSRVGNGIGDGIQNPHAVINVVSSAPVLANTDDSRKDARLPPPRPPPPVVASPPDSNVSNGVIKAIPLNFNDSDSTARSTLSDWTLPSESGALMEDPAIKELLAKSVSGVTLADKNSRERNETFSLLQLDDEPEKPAVQAPLVPPSPSLAALSLLDQFDPLATASPQPESPTTVTVRHPLPNTSVLPNRVSVDIQPGIVRSLAAVYGSQPSTHRVPNVSMFPSSESMASWRHATVQSHRTPSTQSSVAQSNSARQSKDDDLIGL